MTKAHVFTRKFLGSYVRCIRLYNGGYFVFEDLCNAITSKGACWIFIRYLRMFTNTLKNLHEIVVPEYISDEGIGPNTLYLDRKYSESILDCLDFHKKNCLCGADNDLDILAHAVEWRDPSIGIVSMPYLKLKSKQTFKRTRTKGHEKYIEKYGLKLIEDTQGR
jgi:hypothetical protein